VTSAHATSYPSVALARDRQGTRVESAWLEKELLMTSRNGTAAAFDSLKQSMRSFVEAGGETAHRLKGRLVDREVAFEDLIRKHPIAAIGIAFGVGYVLMRVFKR
jgi:hypothetical protein